MMEHSLQVLYGVDAPVRWEVYSAPLPKSHNWFQWGFAARGNKGNYGRKLQNGKAGEKLKGNEKRWEKGRERRRGIAP